MSVQQQHQHKIWNMKTEWKKHLTFEERENPRLKKETRERYQNPLQRCLLLSLSWPENRANEYDDRARVKPPGEEVEPRGGSKAVLCGLRVEDLTLSLTHTCESSCCCGERDEGVGWYGSYRWRQSSERTTAPQKGLTERRESGTACSCSPVRSHSPSFIHVWGRWRRRSFFFSLNDVFPTINIWLLSWIILHC